MQHRLALLSSEEYSLFPSELFFQCPQDADKALRLDFLVRALEVFPSDTLRRWTACLAGGRTLPRRMDWTKALRFPTSLLALHPLQHLTS